MIPVSFFGKLVYQANHGTYAIEVNPVWYLAIFGISLLLIGKILMSNHEDRALARKILEVLEEILAILKHKPRLTKIQIVWSQPMPLVKKAAAASAPLTLALTPTPQSSTGTILGFDQNLNPFPIDFTQYKALWSDDNPAVASSTPSADNSSTVALAVSVGTANFSVAVTRPDGTVISSGPDPVTVVQSAAPVLTSVAIAFSTPTP